MKAMNSTDAMKAISALNQPMEFHGRLSGSASVWLMRFPVRCRIIGASVRYGIVADSKTISISKATVKNEAKFPVGTPVLNTTLPDTTNQYTAVSSSTMFITASTSTSSGLVAQFNNGTNFSQTAEAAGEPVIETNECIVITLPTDATITQFDFLLKAVAE